MDNNYLP
jgi:hypothetical protein